MSYSQLSVCVTRLVEELRSHDLSNLVPRVFVPYCAILTTRATFKSSVAGLILLGFKNNKMAGSHTKTIVESWFLKLSMRNSTGSPILLDFQSEPSRLDRFQTAVQRERRPWVRGCVSPILDYTSLSMLSHSYSAE